MLRLLYLVATLLIANTIYAQPGDMPPNPQPGKCYAKALSPDIKAKPADTTFSTYYRYIGLDNVKLVRRYHDVQIDEFGQAQERVNIDVPKKIGKLDSEDLVLDTLYTYYAPVEARKSQGTYWVEIMCGGDVTPRMTSQICTQLRSNGYQIKGEPQVMSSEAKKALVEYQRDNNLPIGQLDFETLRSLEIDL